MVVGQVVLEECILSLLPRIAEYSDLVSPDISLTLQVRHSIHASKLRAGICRKLETAYDSQVLHLPSKGSSGFLLQAADSSISRKC